MRWLRNAEFLMRVVPAPVRGSTGGAGGQGALFEFLQTGARLRAIESVLTTYGDLGRARARDLTVRRAHAHALNG